MFMATSLHHGRLKTCPTHLLPLFSDRRFVPQASNAERSQVVEQILNSLIDEALPAAGNRAGDVGGQVVNEKAFRWNALSQALAMLKEPWARFAYTDLV